MAQARDLRLRRWVRECLSKNKYSSRRYANRVRRDIEPKRGVKLRVYHCPHCGGYHLTKKL